MGFLVAGACLVGAVPATLRWLRVAQREHYLPGAATRFARRWWTARPTAAVLGAAALGSAVASVWWEAAGLLAAAAVAAGPPGLSVRGSTSPLAWTARLRRVAGVVGVVVAASVVAGALIAPWIVVMVVVALPLVVDVALAALAPVEARMASRWVAQAAGSLRRSGATVVAITGSYGKTSTKGHVAHLVGAVRPTLASPASFNNRMGLARAINEHLASGIEVFVAEMGTYGPGEIADLCSWIPPDVAVITAIGPVHLERFGSEDAIVVAKREILAGESVAVLNVDDPRLAVVAEEEAGRRRVIRVGTSPGLDVTAAEGTVTVEGEVVGSFPAALHPTNVACAVGVALALGLPPDRLGRALEGLTEPEHRRTVATGASGVRIVDDTFNANPAGARAALDLLVGMEVGGRRVVVTPGMVELGDRQAEENRAFAAAVADRADHLVVVGRTNRAALAAGASGAGVTVVDSREEAVAWVKTNLGGDDAVLYENDLPDHYP
jgi:UDP-N-acetylmuramoyl-tripeptide--D-alanyl-D-alanine ligase